jgi:acyl carrier protein
MSRETLLQIVIESVLAVNEDHDGTITEDTDLVGDKILDSLDSMNFLFELEKRLDRQIEGINEDYDDFRVASILNLIDTEA